MVPCIKYSAATHDEIVDVLLKECRFAAVRMMPLAGWSFTTISLSRKNLVLDALRTLKIGSWLSSVHLFPLVVAEVQNIVL